MMLFISKHILGAIGPFMSVSAGSKPLVRGGSLGHNPNGLAANA